MVGRYRIPTREAVKTNWQTELQREFRIHKIRQTPILHVAHPENTECVGMTVVESYSAPDFTRCKSGNGGTKAQVLCSKSPNL